MGRLIGTIEGLVLGEEPENPIRPAQQVFLLCWLGGCPMQWADLWPASWWGMPPRQ